MSAPSPIPPAPDPGAEIALVGTSYVVIDSADVEPAADALRGADAVLSAAQAADDPGGVYGSDVVILLRQDHPDDRAAAVRLREALGRDPRSLRAVEVKGWQSGPLAGWLTTQRPGALPTPGALGVWFGSLPDVLVNAPRPAATAVEVGATSHEPVDWPADPKPVRSELRPVPPLEPSMIPEPLRGWQADIAERICCPLDYPAVGALVSLAIVVGRKVAIRPKRHDDWTVAPNLWGAVIGRPGLLKTPALSETTRPLRRLEAEARQRHAAAQADYQARALVAAAQAAAAKKALQDAARAGEPPEALARLAQEIAQSEAPAAPILRRYTTSDPSVEALGELLRDNPAGVGLIRDELPGWLQSFERAGRECDRAFYLEAWNGNGPSFTYDRIGRGTVHIESPCVSILGGMQPGPLRALLRAVARGEEADDGLISRFQALVWPDTPHEWRNVDRWPDTAAKNRAYKIYQALDTLDPASIDAQADEDGGVPYLRFEPEAQELFDAWRARLEAQLRAPDESPLIESHLSKYRSLMPTLALQFHLIGVADGAGICPVTIGAAELAARWCDQLEAHSRRVYACVTEPDMDAARALADRIKAGALPSPFTHRDVYRRCWSGLDTAELVRRAVATLEDLGWLRTIETPTGGAPRVDVYIHPKLPRAGKKSEDTRPDPTDKTDRSTAGPLLSVLSVPSQGGKPKSGALQAPADTSRPGRRRITL